MKGHGKNGGGRLAGAAVRCQPDSRLVGLAREGHDRAFEEIVRRYRGPLVAFAAAIVANHQAEDVVQEALTKAHSAITQGEAEINLRPWLYTIVRNGALNAVRDETAYEHLHENFDGVLQPAEVAAQREELASLTDGLKKLPGPQREALVKREFEGRGHREIAASMGITPGAVRGLIFRARTALRDGAGMLIPMPVLRWLLSEGSPAAEATGAAGATAAAGLAAGGGGGVAVKAGATLGVAVLAVGSGLAIQERSGKSDDRARAATERPHAQVGAPGTNGAAGVALARSAGGGEGPSSSSGSGGAEDNEGSREDGSSGPDSGPGSRSGPGGGDDSGSGSSGSGDLDSSGSGSSGSGSSGNGSDGDDLDSSGSGSSGSGSDGDDGLDSSGTGSSASGDGLDSSGSGSSGSGSSGSGSDGDYLDSSGSGSSGGGSSGSG